MLIQAEQLNHEKPQEGVCVHVAWSWTRYKQGMMGNRSSVLV